MSHRQGRQVLGCISNKSAANTLTNTISNLPLKQQQNVPQKSYSFDFSSQHSQDENACSQPSSQLSRSKSGFDFEIYKEDVVVVAVEAAEPEYESEEEVYGEDDGEEEEDSEYDENEVDAPPEEEEGISRLNIAINEDSMEPCPSAMDGSFFDRSAAYSPMLLDEQRLDASSSSLTTVDFEDATDEQGEQELDEDELAAQASRERDQVLASCMEYKEEILAYLRTRELENRPKPHYLRKQVDITASMRSILVDWLVEVSLEYKLNTETLYLAVQYTDRFLSQMSVLRGKLQLVGTAGIYLASKYEEIMPPEVGDFVYITDDTYTKKQVLRMEHILIKVLDFRLSVPTPYVFLTHFLRFATPALTSECHHLAKYIAELTLIDAEVFLEYLPSMIAASAFYLALNAVGRTWTRQLSEYVGYTEKEMSRCVDDMHRSWAGAAAHPQQAIQEKYKVDRYLAVSQFEVPANVPRHLTTGSPAS